MRLTNHRDLRSQRASYRETGQALVEFVLVLFPLVVIVGGVIQLGIGIANWHDLNRIANEGARYAATNEWPGCPASVTSCNANPPCKPKPAQDSGRSLVNYLRCETKNPNTVGVVVCSPTGRAAIGEPVTVRLTSRFNALSLDQTDLNKVSWLVVNLRGQATMRLERTPSKYTATPTC